MAPPAVFLPGQFERIQALSPFSPPTLDEEKQRLAGNPQSVHGATRALLLRDVVLADGVLAKGRGRSYLHGRTSRLPRWRLDEESETSALYSSWPGNRYFAHWLMDDCVTYRLASGMGRPVAAAGPRSWPHERDYASMLQVTSDRRDHTRFRELVVFDDVGHNRSKGYRFRQLGELLAGVHGGSRHPGVFVVRGATGERRVMRNEMALAERLCDGRGFRLVDAVRMSAAEIVSACAGSETVVGIEGSHLIHGLLGLVPGGGLLTLQSPMRFCSIYKDLTDRDGQTFGFVVGSGSSGNEDFEVDASEVERTLDLMGRYMARKPDAGASGIGSVA